MELVNEKVLQLSALLANTEKVVVEDLSDASEFRETCRALVQGLKDNFPEQLEGFNPETLSNDNMFVSTAFQALDEVITYLEASGEDTEELIRLREDLRIANERITTLEEQNAGHLTTISGLREDIATKTTEITRLGEQYTETLTEIASTFDTKVAADKDTIIAAITALQEREEFTTIRVAGHTFKTADAVTAYIENLEAAHNTLQEATNKVTTTQESYKVFQENSFEGDVPEKVVLTNLEEGTEFATIQNAITSMQESLDNHQDALVKAKNEKEALKADVKTNAERQVNNFLDLKEDIQNVLRGKFETHRDEIVQIYRGLKSDEIDVSTDAFNALIAMIAPDANAGFVEKVNAINDFINSAETGDDLLVKLVDNVSSFVGEVVNSPEEIERLRAENTEYKEGMERIGNAIKGFDPIIAQMQEIIWEFSTPEEKSRLEKTKLFTIELDEESVNNSRELFEMQTEMRAWKAANDNLVRHMAATGTDSVAYYPGQASQSPGLTSRGINFIRRHAPGVASTMQDIGNKARETLKENSEQKKKNTIEVEMKIFREELNISESVQRNINHFLHYGVLEGMSEEDMEKAQKKVDILKNTGRTKDQSDTRWGRFVNNTWGDFWANFSKTITQDRAKELYRELVDLCDVNRDERRLNEFFDGAEVDKATQTTINEVFEGNLEDLVDGNLEEARTILSKIENSESDETYKFWMKKLCLISDTEVAVPQESVQMRDWTREDLGIPRNLNYAEKLCDVNDQVYSKVSTPSYVANGAFIGYENNSMIPSDQQMTIKAIFSGKKGKLFAQAEINGSTVYVPYYTPLFQDSSTPSRPDQKNAGDYIREKGKVSIARNTEHFQAIMDTLRAEKEALDAILGEDAETEQMTAEVLAKANRVRTLANAAGVAAEEGLAAFTTLAEVRAYLGELADAAL